MMSETLLGVIVQGNLSKAKRLLRKNPASPRALSLNPNSIRLALFVGFI